VQSCIIVNTTVTYRVCDNYLRVSKHKNIQGEIYVNKRVSGLYSITTLFVVNTLKIMSKVCRLCNTWYSKGNVIYNTMCGMAKKKKKKKNR